jgi:histidyl-tRNA synthetase
MAQRVQGTEDLYGNYMRSWQAMCAVAGKLFGTYGFDMIETPAIEQVATFVHGIGESTDVVRKEMFRVFSGALLERLFQDGDESHLKPKQRMAMRPEGTAGVVRAAVEHGFVPQGASPVKVWYAEPMFRGERPQKGRLRQFHQVGVEWLGASDPASDAECIIMLMEFYKNLGLDASQLRLSINSMGDAPLVTDNLCDACHAHYEQVKKYLNEAGVAYVEEPTLVRGLDYYTRTVFEVEYVGDANIGAIGGGGRYDGLMELEGGRPTPGIGFAVGFERIMLALADAQVDIAGDEPVCAYVANTVPELREEAFRVTLALRSAGIRTEADYQGRSLKSQFKQADRHHARVCVVLGPDEVAAGVATVRDMVSHEQRQVPTDRLIAEVTSLLR